MLLSEVVEGGVAAGGEGLWGVVLAHRGGIFFQQHIAISV